MMQYPAISYHLNTAGQGNTIQAISDLHQGTFNGTTTEGISLVVNRVYNYGEILQLLTSAQHLATRSGNTLEDSNIRSYLAAALLNYGSAPPGTCLLPTSSMPITPMVIDGAYEKR